MAPSQFCQPDRVLRRGMRAEPFAAVLNRDRFKLRGGNTAGDGSIVNFDDRRKIGFDGIADCYFCSRGLRLRLINLALRCRGHRPRYDAGEL